MKVSWRENRVVIRIAVLLVGDEYGFVCIEKQKEKEMSGRKNLDVLQPTNTF